MSLLLSDTEHNLVGKTVTHVWQPESAIPGWWIAFDDGTLLRLGSQHTIEGPETPRPFHMPGERDQDAAMVEARRA